MRIIARLDIKGSNLIKGLQLEGLRVIGDPNKYAIKYYNDHFDDSVIEKIILKKNILYKKDKIDLLILDEIQDMTPNIYNLIIY